MARSSSDSSLSLGILLLELSGPFSARVTPEAFLACDVQEVRLTAIIVPPSS